MVKETDQKKEMQISPVSALENLTEIFDYVEFFANFAILKSKTHGRK